MSQATGQQVDMFVNLLQEQGLSVMKAAQQSGIPRSTAYQLRRQYNTYGHLPEKRDRSFEATPAQTEQIINYLDINPKSPIVNIQNLVQDPSRFVTKAKLRSHIEQYCSFLLYEAPLIFALEERMPEIDLERCLFLDEVCYTMRHWVQHTEKGIDVVLVGMISLRGPLGMVKLGPNGPTRNDLPLAEQVSQNPIVVLDPQRVNPETIRAVVEENGGRFCFLSSNQFNPMKACWSKVRSKIRRTRLSEEDSLSPRIKAAWDTISLDDCTRWIKGE
ncbi:unnamed protein product [Rhizopus stolonifer]